LAELGVQCEVIAPSLVPVKAGDRVKRLGRRGEAAALNRSTLPFYPNSRLVSLGECGHYPMQEQPPLLATLIERFLSD
jgi:pimeloyl-ACP methyl ester carboxylesterase